MINIYKMLGYVYDGDVIPDIKLRTDIVCSNMMNCKKSKQVFEKYAKSKVSRKLISLQKHKGM